MRFTLSLLSTVTLGAVLTLAAACGDSTDTTTDAGVTMDAGGGSMDAAVATTLYQRLGGNTGIAGAVDAIVAAELMDPEIAAYFTAAAAYPGAPSAVQIKQCLVAQLGSVSGGPETYPTTVSGNFTCRSMADAHAHLGITSAAFDKFVMIAANVLTTAGVAPADIATIGGVLNSTKPAIATGPTLYQRLGGNAGIAGAIDAIVAAEVMDPEIAAFFTAAGMPNATPNVTQIKQCLVAQLGNAAGGPERYPTMVSGNYTCRSMVDAHAGLGISSAVFDKFVMIAANTLMTAGVAADDIATIGAVLNSTKPDIVR